MKRFVGLLVIIMFFSSLFSFACADDVAIVTKPAGAKGNTVKMRREPGGKVLVNIPFGTEVEVLDVQGEWMQISYDGRIGWMKSEFLSLITPTEGTLSFDVTGEWYEWYTVGNLEYAYDRAEPSDSRFGVDRFFTEDLLVPSDGRMRSIQLNPNGQYIFDNWTDCEVYIGRNDELCICEQDGVQIASLFFVDSDTMWYFGSNEYFAVYKRTPSPNNTYSSSATSSNKSKAIERVLQRKVFPLKKDFPDVYASGIDVRELVVYTEDWSYGRLLTEDIFETVNWDVYRADDKTEIVSFVGTLRTNGRLDTIRIEYCVIGDDAVPLARLMIIESSGSYNQIAVQDFIDTGMGITEAAIVTDASVAQMLSLLYISSDAYVTTGTTSNVNTINVTTESSSVQAYAGVIALYAAAVCDEDFWENYTVAELNLYAIEDWVYWENGTLLYAIYDVNHDGYDELLIAGKSGEYFSIVDIYTTNETTAIRLFGERSFGYRDELDILTNGCLYTHGSSGANNIAFGIYSFTSSGYLEEMQVIDYSGNDMGVINQLRQPYDNMVVDAETAYSWTPLL